jgi:hypothetical protein
MALSPAMQALLKNARNKYQSRGATKVLKIKEGKTRYRVLTGNQNGVEGQFWADLGVHWIKAEKNGKPMAVTGCHEKVHDKPCPICNAIEKAMLSAPDTETENLYKEWRSRKQALLNVIVRDGVDKSDVAQILEVPATVIEQIFGVLQTYADDGIDALDSDSGVDFIIERRGKGFDTEYSVTVPPKSVAVTKAQLDSRHDLADYISREHFRGEETKALNSIAQITGVSMPSAGPALASGRATTAALTNQSVQGAEDFDTEVPFEVSEPISAPVVALKPVAAAPKAAPVIETEAVEDAAGSDMDDLLAELDNMTAE